MLLVVKGLFADFGLFVSELVLDGLTFPGESFGLTGVLFADVIAVLLYEIDAASIFRQRILVLKLVNPGQKGICTGRINHIFMHLG